MLAVTVTLIIILEAISGQFLEQPDPGNEFVPVQDQVTLTCSVEAGYLVDWLVDFPDVNNSINAASSTSQNVFMQRSFTFEGVVTSRSTLSLREIETKINNRTNITCLAQKSGSTSPPTAGNAVQVIFFGAPPPPTDLNVTEDELGSLNISWSLGFIEGVPVNYTLTVLNLNTTSAQPIIIAGLLDQYYVFETSRPCDVYSFTVTAVTAAGDSTPSQEIIANSDSDELCMNETGTGSTKRTAAQSTVYTTDNATTANLKKEASTIIAAFSGAAFITFLIVIFIILYCCSKQRRKMKQADIETQFQDVLVPEHYTSGPQTTMDSLYALIQSNEESELTTRELHNTSESHALGVEVDPQYDRMDRNKSATRIHADFELDPLYNHLDNGSSRKKDEKPVAKEGVYSQVEKDKAVDLSSEEIADKLYAQVDKRRKKKAMITPSLDRTTDILLYAQVDKSRKKKGSSEGTEDTYFYAQVDKSKRKEASLEGTADTLYAQVDKSKTKEAINPSLEGAMDTLYAQVDKKKAIDASLEGAMDTLYAQVDKKKAIDPSLEGSMDILYAQVDKSRNMNQQVDTLNVQVSKSTPSAKDCVSNQGMPHIPPKPRRKLKKPVINYMEVQPHTDSTTQVHEASCHDIQYSTIAVGNNGSSGQGKQIM